MKSVHLALITATVACVFIVNMSDSDGKNESTVITAVNRKTYIDFYYNNISTYFRCEEGQETFMVEERTCVKNVDLFKGEYMHNRYLCIIYIKLIQQTMMLCIITQDLYFT